MTTLFKLDTTVGGQYVGCGIDSAYLSEQFWGSVQLDFDEGADDNLSVCCIDDVADLNDRRDIFDDIFDRARGQFGAMRDNGDLPTRDRSDRQLPKLITSKSLLPSSHYRWNDPWSTMETLPDLVVTSPSEWSVAYETPIRPRAPLQSNLGRNTPRPFSPETPLSSASSFLDTLVRLTQSPIEQPSAVVYPGQEDDGTIFDSEIFVSLIDEHRKARLMTAPRVPPHQDIRCDGAEDVALSWPNTPGTVFDVPNTIDSAIDCPDGMEFLEALTWEERLLNGLVSL